MASHLYLPSAAPEETIEIPVSCFLFRHSHGNVLFDTGCHPTVATDPEDRWGHLARRLVPLSPTGDDVVSHLKRLKLSPDDIDIVVNSHLHCDHCGCNEFFSKATVYVHADELAYARDPSSEGAGYFRADWLHPMPMVEITGEVDIFGDARLVLLPLPGHTPGLTALHAALPSTGAFLLASDAVPLRQHLDLDIIPKNTWNPDLLSDSLAEIKRIEKSGTTVIYGHDDAQWSTFNPAEQCYE